MWARGVELGETACACNLGGLRSKCGDLHGAEAAYRFADEAGNADGSVQLGILLYEKGKPQAAIAAACAETGAVVLTR